jgi:hypothetical protein
VAFLSEEEVFGNLKKVGLRFRFKSRKKYFLGEEDYCGLRPFDW